MMKKTKFKKITAFLMLIAILFSTAQPILATSGTWTGGQFASYMRTTGLMGEYGVLIRNLTDLSTGERRTVFCAEFLVEFTTSQSYNGEFYTPSDPTIRKACKIAYLGWYSKHQNYVIDERITSPEMMSVKKDYVYTQQYIWETLGQSNATFLEPTYQAEYVDFKNNINRQIDEMDKRPSFDSSTLTIQAGESKTLNDTNGVFSKYESINRTQDGITFVHNKGENTLTISVDENTNIENYNISDSTFKSWGLVKEGTQDNGTMIYFEFRDGIQNQLYNMHYNDPVSMKLSLKIELFGKLELQKLDTTGELVDGATYNVSGNNYNKDVVVENGKITIEKLKKGTYTIKEKNAPKGYLLDVKSYNVEVKPNQTASKAIVNSEPTGKIKINKTDIITGNSNNRVDGTSHHGDATLKGAIYTLYAKENIYNVSHSKQFFNAKDEIATFTFDEYGNAKINITNTDTKAELKVNEDYLDGLPMGKYYAKETTVPKGYKLDTKIYDYELKYKDQNTDKIVENYVVTNDVQRAKFEVIKVSTNDNNTANKVANAEFTAILNKYVDYYGSFEKAKEHLNEYADDEYSIFKTGEDGHGISKALAYGEYMVEETYTPNDEIETVEPFYINIDKDSDGVIKEFVENDLPFESYIKMIKVDKKTGKVVTFSDTTFSLYRLNDNGEWEKVKCKTGLFYSDKWKTDKTGVAVTEDKLQCGTYKIDEIKLPKGFLELEDEIIFEINRSNKNLEFDSEYDAYITIKVGNEQPTGTIILDKSVALKDNVDTSLVDVSDLSKIEFTLVAKEKIIDMADGSTIYEKGAKVGNYKLSKDGKLEINNLPMGKYELKEIKTLDGVVLNDNPIEIVFEKKDNTTKVYTETREVENKPTEVEISKTTITGDEELEGAELEVIDENGEIVDKWTSTKESHKIEGLLVNKEYTLREKIAPDGFVKATEIKFRVDNNNDIQKVVMIDKILEVSKTDFITSEEIEGAELEVIDENGKIVDKWTSTKESHKVRGLEEGKTYVLRETTAPYGYEVTEEITFVVTSDKEIQKVEMKDMPILKNIKVIKVDSKTKETIKDKFAFTIYEDPECTKLIKEVNSNKDDGTALFEELRYGVYYIKETKAPKGYELSTRIIKVEINDKGIFIDDNKVEEKNSTIEFSFENVKIEVPKTGDENKLFFIGGIVMLSILSIIVFSIYNYKRGKKSN